jgi:drug/metabolite transporter (DMT)-like permease
MKTDRTAPPQTSISPLAWGMLFCLALLWGGSFTSTRAAVAELGPLTIVAFRVTGAAVLLWAYVLIRGVPRPSGMAVWGRFLVMGIFNNVIPFSLISWGQTHIPSGLAGILNASTAIFTVLLVGLLFPDERLTLRKAIGVGLGFAGVAVTIGVHNLRALDFTSLGQLAVLGAALSYATVSAYARRALRGIRPEVSAAGMLSSAALVMVPLALLMDGVPALNYHPGTWIALVYLSVAASALAYILYLRVLALAGAGNLSLVTLMIAPVAILLGAVFFGETLAPAAYAGFGLLALGLLVIDGRILRRVRAFSA